MLSAHATDVYHFAEIVSALKQSTGSVDLLTRYQWSKSSLDAFQRRVPLPRRVLEIAERRVQVMPPGIGRHRFLPASQLYYPAIGRLKIDPNPSLARLIHARYGDAVARFSRRADLLHGTEGMSARAFAERPDRLNVLEQRNYHYGVFEQEWPVVDGFPDVAVRNPLASSFDEEYEKADLIRVYSEGVVNDFVARGYRRSKFAVVPLSVPVRQQIAPVADRRPRDPHALLYVGRPDASKGLDVASAATRLLGSPFTLTVAGPTTGIIQEWMATQSHIRYVGIRSRSELEDIYATHSFLLAPSVESFGLAVLEGYSAGINVMCAGTTGVGEYLPDGAAFVMPNRRPESWAAQIQSIVESGDWREADAASRGPIETLTPASVIEALSDMYSAALGSKGMGDLGAAP